jgi:hypothetical protein
MKRAFTSRGETMCHGDLHAGSIMVTVHCSRGSLIPNSPSTVPFGFDIGMLIGNYLMAYHAMPAHISDVDACKRLSRTGSFRSSMRPGRSIPSEFLRLWRTERTGILYPKALYEDQGHQFASEAAARAAAGRNLPRPRRLRRHRDAPEHSRPGACRRTRHHRRRRSEGPLRGQVPQARTIPRHQQKSV